MPLNADSLRGAVRRAAGAARAAEADLNAADGKLGDGDTGVTLRRLFEAIEAAAPADETDVGAVFLALGTACARATGSSLGTLVTVSMLTLAKPTHGRTEIAWDELGPLLEQVRDAMMARGGAALGDKTVVDMLDAVAAAIKGLNDPDAMAGAVMDAAEATLSAFRDRPNRIGRARMFGDRSVGLDDPGMLAFSLLLRSVALSAANPA